MLSPRLTNCKECANIPSLILEIDCKIADMSNALYNNISFMLNQSFDAYTMNSLLNYRRILSYKTQFLSILYNHTHHKPPKG